MISECKDEVAQIFEPPENMSTGGSQASDDEETKTSEFRNLSKMDAGDVIMQELDDLIED